MTRVRMRTVGVEWFTANTETTVYEQSHAITVDRAIELLKLLNGEDSLLSFSIEEEDES